MLPFLHARNWSRILGEWEWDLTDLINCSAVSFPTPTTPTVEELKMKVEKLNYEEELKMKVKFLGFFIH